jgi:hypothetical protein
LTLSTIYFLIWNYPKGKYRQIDCGFLSGKNLIFFLFILPQKNLSQIFTTSTPNHLSKNMIIFNYIKFECNCLVLDLSNFVESLKNKIKKFISTHFKKSVCIDFWSRFISFYYIKECYITLVFG